ncbi:MAG: serine/threonine protein phosphatase [Candidatus Methanomethyliaceae archaeon]|nr:serine/threonine protein phosphatase [Candidatus Methanomethyliaceae archaeon]
MKKTEKLKQLIDHAKELILEEKKKFRIGQLLKIKDFPIVVIGDIHGDYISLETITKKLEVEGEWNKIVFLGDYADRGPSPLEVYTKILEMKCSHPDEVFLLKGNHEAVDLIEFYPHDLPWHIKNAYGEYWREIYDSLMNLHRTLPIAVIVESIALLLHGGISPEITPKGLEDPTKEELEIILWSDPSEHVKGTTLSNRGAGVLFGPDVSFSVLDKFGVKYLIRGHSPVTKGYRWDHAGRVLTIFAAKHVYGLESGAYALIDSKDPPIEIKLF